MVEDSTSAEAPIKHAALEYLPLFLHAAGVISKDTSLRGMDLRVFLCLMFFIQPKNEFRHVNQEQIARELGTSRTYVATSVGRLAETGILIAKSVVGTAKYYRLNTYVGWYGDMDSLEYARKGYLPLPFDASTPPRDYYDAKKKKKRPSYLGVYLDAAYIIAKNKKLNGVDLRVFLRLVYHIKPRLNAWDCVNQTRLSEELGTTNAEISRSLKKLCSAGIIEREMNGKKSAYRLNESVGYRGGVEGSPSSHPLQGERPLKSRRVRGIRENLPPRVLGMNKSKSGRFVFVVERREGDAA